MFIDGAKADRDQHLYLSSHTTSDGGFGARAHTHTHTECVCVCVQYNSCRVNRQICLSFVHTSAKCMQIRRDMCVRVPVYQVMCFNYFYLIFFYFR